MENQQTEIKRKNTIVYAFVGGFLLMLILALVIFRSYRQKKKANELFIDQKGTNIIETSGNTQIKEIISVCLEKKETVVYTAFSETKSGRKIWVQTTLTPILGTDGSITKLVAIDSDISKIKEAEAEINRKNTQITDSINYAKLIQEALLPSEKLLKSHFRDSFILFKPKDIVSGDFYWFSEQNNKLFIAVVDCTGHGVPGAFMSMIGITLLNEIINNKKIDLPSLILLELNESVNYVLHQKGFEDTTQDDGMDISLCCYNLESKMLTIACANHNAYIINSSHTQIVKGDIFSIGGNLNTMHEIKYTDHHFEFVETTSVYLYTVGYQDQFGGKDGLKFMPAKFRSLLVEIQPLEATEQYQIMNSTFEDWKGNRSQLDDVTIIGLKI